MTVPAHPVLARLPWATRLEPGTVCIIFVRRVSVADPETPCSARISSHPPGPPSPPAEAVSSRVEQESAISFESIHESSLTVDPRRVHASGGDGWPFSSRRGRPRSAWGPRERHGARIAVLHQPEGPRQRHVAHRRGPAGRARPTSAPGQRRASRRCGGASTRPGQFQVPVRRCGATKLDTGTVYVSRQGETRPPCTIVAGA